MKKIISTLVLIVIAYFVEQNTGISLFDSNSQNTDSSSTAQANYNKAENQAVNPIQAAYNKRQSDVQIRYQGTVSRLLADDLKGSRHQKFILKIDRLSILIAHNIDLAPKINTLRKGDTVEFYGEYEWNEKGGIVHWTHRDPGGRHKHGWLKHKGKTYQ